jgi:hypothetical protein
MLVNIKAAVSWQKVCQNINPPPNFVLFLPFCNLFSSIGIFFSLKALDFGLRPLSLGGNHTPPVGKPNISVQEFGAGFYFCFVVMSKKSERGLVSALVP